MQNTLGEKQFTVGIFISTKVNPRKVLLLHHKKAGTWLQPGGHIEHTENPIEALIREIKEEVGLDISSHFVQKEKTPESYRLPLPRFILEEKIPQHGNHPFHYHVDLLYTLEVENELPTTLLEKEAYGIGWFNLEEIKKLPLFANTRSIVEELLQ